MSGIDDTQYLNLVSMIHNVGITSVILFMIGQILSNFP